MNGKTSMQTEVLSNLFMKRLIELEPYANVKSKIIRFPLVFEKICRLFSIDKKSAWEVLMSLRSMGLIEIIRFQGVRIIYDAKSEEMKTRCLIDKIS